MRSATIVAASLLTPVLALPLASAASADIAISIDKTTQQMSVAVDGSPRYTWPVSTGRPGYDTPNGSFKVNRMDADHFSQEWDNAPMPHTMFFDLHGHAIHGFFDVKHLGMAVSHGCVRLSPDHATTLFDLVKSEGMANTSVVVTGRTPGGDNGPVARSHLPENEEVYNSQPMPIAPQYQQQAPQYQEQQEYPPQQEYVQRQGFPQQPQPYYGQRYYAQPNYYGGQPYSGQGYDAPPGYYGQPAYRQW
jgi:L,D-transpeptidase-like protein